ncbi:hypothetical protein LCGC14_0810540 [marine sediment metagenome]|uniref:C2H2-type domain-containing protein n=1 Tax=marine sediment metagenome TaxID=412755 RepID=A0A0F9PM08_9ZZZZ
MTANAERRRSEGVAWACQQCDRVFSSAKGVEAVQHSNKTGHWIERTRKSR